MTQHALSGFCTNATGGLARLWCEKCAEECIHRGSTCIHCGSSHRFYPVRDLAKQWVAKGITIVRAKRARK
jgi:hypothetical protein